MDRLLEDTWVLSLLHGAPPPITEQSRTPTGRIQLAIKGGEVAHVEIHLAALLRDWDKEAWLVS